MLRVLQQFILTTLFAVFASQASAMFIQSDWFDPTQPGVGTNRYAYSGNDPINRYDPLGNAWIDEGWDALIGEGSFDRTFGEGSAQAMDDTADAIGRANGAVIDTLDYYSHSMDAASIGVAGKPVKFATGIAKLGSWLGRLVRGTRANPNAVDPDAVAGSIRKVNPTGSGQNCVNCAIATDNTLAGFPTSAMPGNPTSVRVLEKHFGSTFRPVANPKNISDIMIEAGSGSRGIVFGSRGPNEVGHVFNVVNQNGTVRFLDGQTGTVANLNRGYKEFFFLPTN